MLKPKLAVPLLTGLTIDPWIDASDFPITGNCLAVRRFIGLGRNDPSPYGDTPRQLLAKGPTPMAYIFSVRLLHWKCLLAPKQRSGQSARTTLTYRLRLRLFVVVTGFGIALPITGVARRATKLVQAKFGVRWFTTSICVVQAKSAG